jgi:predicted nucleic acid-binding protein
VTVVDASVVVELLLRTPSALLIEERLFESEQDLHAPHLIDLEVTQALRRYDAKGLLTAAGGHAALSVFVALPIRRWPHVTLLPRIWALRQNLTAYDASYVALAETIDAPLLTRDRALANAPGHRARIEFI